MEYHYVEGMDRNEQDKVVSHIYAGKVKGDPEGPLCVRGWNRSDGMGFSIFRGNQMLNGFETRGCGYQKNGSSEGETTMAQTHNRRGDVCNRPMTAGERSFDAGYRYGMSDGAEDLSPREIADRFPEVADSDAFCQGMIDGLHGDDWRHRCMVEHIRSGHNMDSVLVAEMEQRKGYMATTIGHGPQGDSK